jgi:three-Cys-motif partner protein
VEISHERADELARVVAERDTEGRAQVIHGNINRKITDLLVDVPASWPALCVLDPYDPDDLHFTTIQAIAADKFAERKNKVEVFVNLPIGLQNRQARDPTTGILRPKVVQNLTALLGNSRWLPSLQAWAAGQEEWHHVYGAMRRSFDEELAKLGYTVRWQMDVPSPINPFYALFFAATHPLAGSIMESAMKDWERDPANPQRPLF